MAIQKKKKASNGKKLTAKKLKATKGGAKKIRASDLNDLEADSPGTRPGGWVVGVL